MTIKSPLVSIIIPCFNYGHLIHETLDSVIAQYYPNWECIIVDDGSTDNSKAVIEKYTLTDRRFHYVYQENRGLAGARNTGMRLSKGVYIQFLDADDLLKPTKIEEQVRELNGDDKLAIVYGDVYRFKHGQDPVTSAELFKLINSPVSGRGFQILEGLVRDNFFLVHCPLVRKSAVDGIFFNEGLNAFEDWNFWYKSALANCEFLYQAGIETIVYVRDHGHNMSGDRKRMWLNKIKARIDIMEHDNQLSKGKRLSLNLIQTHQQLLYQDQFRYNLMFGNLALGIFYCIKYMFASSVFFQPIREAAYWIKERSKSIEMYQSSNKLNR